MNALTQLDMGTAVGIAVFVMVLAAIVVSTMIDGQRRGADAAPAGPLQQATARDAGPQAVPGSAGAVLHDTLESARKSAIVAELDRRITTAPDVSGEVDRLAGILAGKKAAEAPKSES